LVRGKIRFFKSFLFPYQAVGTGRFILKEMKMLQPTVTVFGHRCDPLSVIVCEDEKCTQDVVIVDSGNLSKVNMSKGIAVCSPMHPSDWAKTAAIVLYVNSEEEVALVVDQIMRHALAYKFDQLLDQRRESQRLRRRCQNRGVCTPPKSK
jgi:hypothetical protein